MIPRKELFQTGIPSLDTILGGGLLPRQTLMVAGNPGTGKTVLGSQVAFLAAARGLPVVLATVTSESHDKLLDELSGFTFFRQELLGDHLLMISAYASLKNSPREARDLLLGTVRERGARLLFCDGLRAIRALWRDEGQMREFLYELNVGLSALNCIGLFSTEYPADELMSLPEATTMDGILSLELSRHGTRRLRRAEVLKLRGRPHLTGQHHLEISGDGVRIIPRLEAFAAAEAEAVPSGERAGFGLPELDALIDSGLPGGSITVLAGGLGIGKTLLAAHFAREGAQKGEKSLFVSFFEAPGILRARALRVGLDLDPSIATGALQFIYLPPSEVEADGVIDHILAEVARTAVRRVVIDGLGSMELSVADVSRRHGLFAALSVRLRQAGVTTVFTKEISKLVGTELDFSDTPIAIFAENLLLLRYVELRGRIHRIVSVLKMRDSKYDSDLREFEISDLGFHVLAPVRSADGVLTGQARLVGSGEERRP